MKISREMNRKNKEWEKRKKALEAVARRDMGRNPIVFLDVSIGDEPSNRMIFELFSDVSPLMAENFRALCTGVMGKGQRTKKPLCYQGSTFHQVTKGYIQGGDFSNRDGSGGESIYGGKFKENNCVPHNKRGLLTMSSKRAGSQFRILLNPNAHFDRKHTVFGNLVSGHDVLGSIEGVPVRGPYSIPDVTIRIVDCGELIDRKVLDARTELEKQWAVESDSSESDCDTSSSESSKGRKRRKLRRSTGDSGPHCTSSSQNRSLHRGTATPRRRTTNISGSPIYSRSPTRKCSHQPAEKQR